MGKLPRYPLPVKPIPKAAGSPPAALDPSSFTRIPPRSSEPQEGPGTAPEPEPEQEYCETCGEPLEEDTEGEYCEDCKPCCQFCHNPLEDGESSSIGPYSELCADCFEQILEEEE